LGAFEEKIRKKSTACEVGRKRRSAPGGNSKNRIQREKTRPPNFTKTTKN